MRHLKRARQLADALKGELPDYRYIGRITKALVTMGEREEASRIVNAIGDTNWNRKLKILIDIANAHTEIGDGRAALMALHNSLQSAKTGTDRIHVLMMIANVQMKNGRAQVCFEYALTGPDRHQELKGRRWRSRPLSLDGF